MRNIAGNRTALFNFSSWLQCQKFRGVSRCESRSLDFFLGTGMANRHLGPKTLRYLDTSALGSGHFDPKSYNIRLMFLAAVKLRVSVLNEDRARSPIYRKRAHNY